MPIYLDYLRSKTGVTAPSQQVQPVQKQAPSAPSSYLDYLRNKTGTAEQPKPMEQTKEAPKPPAIEVPAIDKALASDIAPDQGFKGYQTRLPSPSDGALNLGEAWKVGSLNVQKNKVGYDMAMDKGRPFANAVALEALNKEIEQHKPYLESKEKQNFLARGLQGAVEMFPLWLAGADEGLKWAMPGAAAGAGAAAIAGQLGPQVALPEELVTVPGAALAGGIKGFKLGTMLNIGKLEAGGAYLDYIEAGVSPNVAKPAALITGTVNAVIEQMQLDSIFKGTGLLKAVRDELTKKALLKVAVEYGKGVLSESLEEAAQQLMTDVAGEAAKMVDNYKNGKQLETKSIGEIVSAAGQEFVGSIPTMTVLGVLGLSGDIRDMASDRQARQQAQAPKIATLPIEAPKIIPQTPRYAQGAEQRVELPQRTAPIDQTQSQQAPVAPPSLSEGQGNRVIPPSLPMPLKTPPAEFSGSRVQYPAPSSPEAVRIHKKANGLFDIKVGDQVIGGGSMLEDDGIAYLERIDISEQYRNRGYGSRALRELTKVYGTYFLAADNEDAQRLYDRVADRMPDDEYNNYGFAIDQGFGVHVMEGQINPDYDTSIRPLSQTTPTASQLPQEAISSPPPSSSRTEQGEGLTGVAGTKVEPPKLEQKPAPKVPELRQETEPVRRQDLDAIDEDEWNRGYQDAMSGTRMDIAALGDELSAYAQGVEFARRDRYIKDYLLESHRRINEIMGRDMMLSDIDDAVIAHAEQGKPLPPGIHVIKKGAKAPAVKLANKLGHALMLIQTSNSQGIPIESLTKSKYYMELPWKLEPSNVPNEANIYYGTPYSAVVESHQNFAYIPDADKWASDVMEPFSHVNPFRRWLNQEKAKQAEEAEIGTEEVRQEVAPKATQPPSEATPPPFPSSSMAEKGEGRREEAGAKVGPPKLEQKPAPKAPELRQKQGVVETIKAFNAKLSEMNLTAEEVRAHQQWLKDNKENIVAHYLELVNKHPDHKRRRKATKQDIAERSFAREYRRAISQIIGVTSHHLGETPEQGIDRAAAALTDEDIAKAKAKRAEEQKAVKQPETLKELLIARTRRELTADERAKLEHLLAVERRENEQARQKQAEAKRTDINDLAVEPFTHTKTGEKLFLVKPKTRLEREAFTQLRQQMKELGGTYSSFAKGFLFQTDPTEQLGGLTSAEVAPVEQTSNADKLRQMADNLQPKIDEKLSPRLDNTARRAKMAASAEADGRYLQTLQRTLRNIADGIESGNIKLLDRITAMTEIEALERALMEAKHQYERANNIEYRERKDRKVGTEDIAAAEFKATLHHDHLKRAIMKGEITPGLVRIAKRLAKLKPSGHLVDITRHIADVEKLAKGVGEWDRSDIKETIEHHKRLERIGITSTTELRAMLREYLSMREQRGMTKEQQIRAKQRELIGTKIPGYFPTPKAVVDKMLDAADIQEGDKVLEPSAGQGHIADAVGVGKVDVVEISPSNREILELKGHKLVGDDALKVEGQYDKIVMNPPFENGQDMDHVRYAYDHNLKPGGRLVAIMSEGSFFRGDKKATAFREWLEEVGGTAERLPEGSFKSSDRPTGVATRMVTIEKPGSAEAEIAAPSEPITQTEAIAAVEQAIEDTKKAGGFNFSFDLQQFAKDEQKRLTGLLDDVKQNGITDSNRGQVEKVVKRRRDKKAGKGVLPMSERDYENVVHAQAYSVQNPEAAPFLKDEARKIKGELEGGTKGERAYIHDPWGYVDTVKGIKRHTSPTVETILDTLGATYKDAAEALDEIIAGNPASALAKRIELLLHDNLIEGVEDMEGNWYEPDPRYARITREIEKNFYKQQFEQAKADFESRLAKEKEKRKEIRAQAREKQKAAVKKAKLTERDKAKQRIERIKERHKDDMATQRNLRKEAVAKLKESAERRAAKAKELADRKLQAQKRKADFQIASEREAAKMAEGRIRATYKQKLRAERQKAIDQRRRDQSVRLDQQARRFLKKQVRRLRLKRTKLLPAYEQIRKQLLPMFDTAISGNGTLNLSKAKQFLKGKDDGLAARLDLIDGLEAKELNADSYDILSDLARSIIAQNRNENRLMAEAKNKSMEQAIDEVLQEIGAPKRVRVMEPKPGPLDLPRSFYGTESMTPRALAKYLSGGKEGTLFRIFYANLDKGQNESLALEQKAKTYIAEQMQGVKMESWTGERARKPIKLVKGTLELTPMEMISLRLAGKNEDNRRHLMAEKGGGTIEGLLNPHVFTDQDFLTIEKALTVEQKRYADALAYVFDEILKPAINERSVVLDGYEKAKVKNYFPIVIAKHLQDKDFSKFIRWATLEGKGYLKEREHGTQPISIEDASRAVDRAIHMVSDYYGLAIPLRDAKLILGNSKVSNALWQKHGNRRAERVYQELFRQLEGGRLSRTFTERGFSTLSSNIIKSILGANPWIVMQQFASLPKAAAFVDPKYLLNTRKANWETIYKYSPYIWKRGQGYVSKEAAELADARRLGTSGKLETVRVKVSDFMLQMIEKADAAVIGRIWLAVESEVKATTKLQGDAFYQEVARRTEDIVKRTQQSGLLMQRSAITRTENDLMRVLVAFTSEMNATANMVREAWMDRKTNPKHLARTIAVVTASAMFSATINVLRNKWRGREEDWVEEMVNAAISPIYFAEAMLGVLKGVYYASIGETVTQGALNDFLDSLSDVGKAIQGDMPPLGAAREVLTKASTLLGIPANNILRELDNIISNIDPRIAYEWKKLFKTPTSSDIYDTFFAELKRTRSLRGSQLLNDLRVDMKAKNMTPSLVESAAKRRNSNKDPNDDINLRLLRDLERWMR